MTACSNAVCHHHQPQLCTATRHMLQWADQAIGTGQLFNDVGTRAAPDRHHTAQPPVRHAYQHGPHMTFGLMGLANRDNTKSTVTQHNNNNNNNMHATYCPTYGHSTQLWASLVLQPCCTTAVLGDSGSTLWRILWSGCTEWLAISASILIPFSVKCLAQLVPTFLTVSPD